MQENLSGFDTLKLATQYWHGDQTTTILIIILFFLAAITFFILGTLLQKKIKEKNLKHYFDMYAKEQELNEKEKEILWEYAKKMERDPILVLEFKAPFEKVVDLYIHSDPNADENLVRDMRKKLDFEILSPYIPLITTKDIEIFQNGRMIFPNNQSVNVALYDKDERYMYWLVIDGTLPSSIQPGEQVKVIFLRQEDGIYSFELPIADIIKEGNKTIIKFPHTFELNRTQRRESPRVKIDLPLNFAYQKNGKKYIFEGRFIDISSGGARFCTTETTNEVLKKIRFGDTVELVFNLDNHTFTINAKVLDIDKKPKALCLRTIFSELDEHTKENIIEFVQKEQIKVAKLKKE